jgi:hypothetical protein
MQIVYHMGVHCTDEDQLIRSLLKSRDRLARDGIMVPAPGRYRPILSETLKALQGQPASEETQQTILDAVIDHDTPQRVIFSSETFLGATGNAIGEGIFYPRAGRKSAWFPRLFPHDGCEFHLAIRNPAAFLPALFSRLSESDFNTMMSGGDPLLLRWSDLVIRIRDANPGVPLTVWCDEDAPLIWPEVLQAVAGIDAGAPPLEGDHDRLRGLMSTAGQDRLAAYLESHPPQTVEHRRRIVAAFLDKYAIDEAMEVELDLPGWTADYVEALTEAYEEDTRDIARLEGVTFLEY